MYLAGSNTFLKFIDVERIQYYLLFQRSLHCVEYVVNQEQGPVPEQIHFMILNADLNATV